MRILQINSARTIGGGERHFADLANALAARGHEVYAALRPGSPLGGRPTSLPAENVLRLPLLNAVDLWSAGRLARFVRARKIEIVHAHLARDYPVASLAARLGGARLVITRHVPFPLGKVHRFTLSNAARVIAVSAGVGRGLVGRGIFPADRVRVVPNGVRMEAYDRALEGFDRESYRKSLSVRARLLVGAVGDLSEAKGQEDFVRAAVRVSRLRGDLDAAFLVVGEDNSPARTLRRRLEWMIAEEGLAGRVRLLGYVSDLVPLLAALDLYVSPARAEAFGLATVEAMACGACVVATDTDGAREIVTNGETGHVTPVADPDALAEAIIRLLEDDAERRRLAERGRADVRARFDLERMIDATEEVYRQALGGKSGR